MVLISQVVAQEQQEEPAGEAITQRQLTLMKADILKQIETISTSIQEDNRKYNDENYIAFDQRMQAFIKDMQRKIIFGILGLNFFIAAIIGFTYNWINKKHSLYSYQKGLDKRQEKIEQGFPRQHKEEFSDIQQAQHISPNQNPQMASAEFFPQEQPYPEQYPQQPYPDQYAQPPYPDQYAEPYPEDRYGQGYGDYYDRKGGGY
jgi:hypothetical protein